ncbi:MAG: S-layer protein [Candidatus Aenigmarchaeota archaeon]|nr:S-layer protein [Candidatus Aenigmarchaeota archaeon]
MFVVRDYKNGKELIAAKEIEEFPRSKLAIRILQHLAKKPSYPKEISRFLKEDEQKIYYHMRKMEKMKIIRAERHEAIGGAVAKIYSLTRPAFVMRFADFVPAERPPSYSGFLSAFIKNGILNAKIVIGSPDPHGPEKARSRDAYYAVDLALFIGSCIANASPSVLLDTGIGKEEMNDNLVIVGGPVTNKVTKLVNPSLPVRFAGSNIYSSYTGKTYKSDDVGFLIKAKNPLNKDASILLLAGRRHSGTKAAILAIFRYKQELEKGYAIVEGIDEDGDGTIDSVRMLE